MIAVLAAAAAVLTAPRVDARPDILLVVLDDVGWADFEAVHRAGFLPNIDALARRGFTFRNCSSNPGCQPTRRSIYFGDFWSEQSGAVCARASGSEPPSAAVSLAAALPAYSRAFFGKWHVGANPLGPFQRVVQDRGWDEWLAGVPAWVVGAQPCPGFNYWTWYAAENGVGYQLVNLYQPEVMLQRFETWWTTAAQPRFAVYAMQLAHSPYHRPPPAALPPGYPDTPDARSRFEAMIAAADVHLGQLVSIVDLARTVVILVSDNGTPRDVAPDPTRAKTTTFQGGIHVPLVVAGAGIPFGQSWALVHVVDLYATIVELSGGTSPPQLDSRSLLPLVHRTQTRVHERIASGLRFDPAFDDDVCARNLRFKLRRWKDNVPGAPQVEQLYDLLLDPGEFVDRIHEPGLSVTVAQLRAFLDAEFP